MQKTKKALIKRFKITGSGKVMRRKPGRRHLLRNKSQRQRQRMDQDQGVGKGYAKTVRAVASVSGNR